MRRILTLVCLLCLWSSLAHARMVEPDTWSIGAAVGPSFKFGSTLGASPAYGTLALFGEYAMDAEWGLVASGELSMATTLPARLHLGGTWRKSHLDLPISPYLKLEFTLARLYHVLGADLTALGGRVGAGVDYFLTSQLTAGAYVGVDLLGTRGERPAFVGWVDALVYAAYVF